MAGSQMGDGLSCGQQEQGLPEIKTEYILIT